MKLTDNEKREILKLIDAGKSLPDKYRFLLFYDKREVELVWNGKTNEVTNIVLPFQVIEQIDEPRAEKPDDSNAQFGLFDTRGRQKSGWTNKLIWGDNKLILSSLKNGPLCDEIEKQGGIKLIYIDPPFSAGIDYSIDMHIGVNVSLREEEKQKQLEQKEKDFINLILHAYRTKNWTDWIDYWSVDFNFESKREIVRVKNGETGNIEEVWTGDFVFENEWQSFRTKKTGRLNLKLRFMNVRRDAIRSMSRLWTYSAMIQ